MIESSSLHLLNIINLMTDALGDTSLSHFLHKWENNIFALAVLVFLCLLTYVGTSRAKLIPTGRFQIALEGIVEALDGFVTGILGARGSRYTPFLGTLFLYIWTMNMMGLVPLSHSATSSLLITAPLAVCVFIYVQSVGIKENGILGYLDHMAGAPRDAFGIILAPLMFVIHVIGELAKPLSLSLRLFGNIMGEHMLLAVFIGLGVGMFKYLSFPMGLPIHIPFVWLSILTGTIQAFVFTLLSTVYIAMMLPHEHEGHPSIRRA